MSCNGDCYQGRWCDCKDESYNNGIDETKYAYVWGCALVFVVGILAWLVK